MDEAIKKLRHIHDHLVFRGAALPDAENLDFLAELLYQVVRDLEKVDARARLDGDDGAVLSGHPGRRLSLIPGE